MVTCENIAKSILKTIAYTTLFAAHICRAPAPEALRVRNQQELVTMTSTLTRVLLVCLFLAAVLLSAGCIGEDEPSAGQAATEFRGETSGYDNRVEFRFIPNSDEPGTYSATYTIERDVSWGTTIETRENVRYEEISRGNPIEIVVPREEPLDGVALEIEIRNAAGEVLHQSRMSVAPATPVPTSL